MRSIIVMAMFTASLAGAAWDGYEEQRELHLSASDIDAGSGSLEISGVSGSDEIVVTAIIQVPNRNDDKAREAIESNLVLALNKQGDTAVLKVYFEQKRWNFGGSPSVHLVVKMPDNLHLAIDDGSGSMSVSDIAGAIEVEDGSGSIDVSDVEQDLIIVDDGSGGLTFSAIKGRVEKDS